MKTRWLAYAFAVSAALNGAFVITYFTKKRVVRQANPKTAMGSLAEVLDTYVDLPRESLFALLGDPTLVEDGYSRSDLALASLVACHKFDIERALGVVPVQQRRIALVRGGEKVALTLYPGLSEHDHLEISHFAKTEVWPLTAEGLFQEWAEHRDDPSLRAALAMTVEYRHVQALLATKGIFLERDELLAFLSDLDHPRTARNYAIDEEGCRHFLLEALGSRSQMAASLLIEYDKEKSLSYLSDDQLLLLLDLAIDHPALELVAKNLLCSLRSDAVRQGAGEVLYTLADLPVPSPYDHQEALNVFLPNFFTPKVPQARTHIVEEGDTLWHLARRYKVDIEVFKRHNGLESEFSLRPGMKLEVPQK